MPTVIGSIVIGSSLTRFALPYYVYYLKAAPMNRQRCLILELILSEFERLHNAVEATRHICSVKGKGGGDPFTVNKLFKKRAALAEYQESLASYSLA